MAKKLGKTAAEKKQKRIRTALTRVRQGRASAKDRALVNKHLRDK